MPTPPVLPAGFSARAATTADAKAISLIAGNAVDEVEATLERPGLDASVDTLVVLEPAGEVVAWTYVRGRRSQVDVGPAHRGLGLGGSLLDWAEARAVEIDGEWLAQTVDDEDQAGTALLQARGYEVLATNWMLGMPATAVVPELPAGYTIRPFTDEDRAAAHLVIQDAFDEWQPRRWEYEEWARMSVERSTFVPGISPVILAGDELVGVAICLELPGTDEGLVEQLAVHRDHRGKGLARALLAFASSRCGRPNLTLWTHSDTGALAMYERLGMSVSRSTTVFRREL